MATGKIKSVVQNVDKDGVQRSFTTDNGTFYVFVVEMEDGTRGEVNSKTPGTYRFAPGTEVEYTYTANANPQYLGKLKVEKPGGAQGGFAGGKGWSPEKEASVMIQGLLKSIIETTAPADQWPQLLAKALDLHDRALKARMAKPAQATATPAQVEAPSIDNGQDPF